jgi:hypothetical protein
VAHWLLAHEAVTLQHAHGHATAADRVHAQLRTGLVVFLGPTGFDSLWARAEHLAQPVVPTPVGAAVLPPDARVADPDHAAVLARFIALLFTFVGTALSVRLLRQSWPTLPLDAAALETSDGTV